MSSDIGIRVQVEGGSAAAGELDKVGESAERMGGSVGSLKDAFDDIDGALGMVGTSLGGLASYLKDSIDQGDALADIMSQMGDASNDAAREMTQGLIPALDLAQARGRALAAGLELTDQQFAAVAAAAQVYALRTGTDGAAAVERLSNALVSGSERALRPFGIQLEAGATRSENTAAALAQLSAAADANAANVARSTGAWDRLGTVYDVVKEKMSGLHTFTFGLIDGVGRLTTLVGDLASAIGRGDANGLATALNDAGVEGQQLVAQLPVIGSAAAAATSGVRALANSLLDAARAQGLLSYRIAQAATAEQLAAVAAGARRPGMGDRLMLDRGLDTQRFDDEVRRDASRAEVQREMYERRNAGGGGGGAGSRQTIEEQLNGISAAVDRFLDRLDEQRRRADADEARGGGLFGITDDEDRADRNRDVAPGFNREGRGTVGRGNLGGARNASQQVSAFARQTEAAQKYGGALEALKLSGVGALGALQGAIESNVAAWVAGEQSIGQALAGILSQTLTTIATEATVKALLATAEGLFLTATMKYDGAAAAFAAAGTYAAVAVLAGGGAAAMSAASGGGGGARRSSGSTARANGGAVSGAGAPAGTVIQQFILSPGTGLEGPRHLATQLRRSDLQERRQRNIRAPMPVR